MLKIDIRPCRETDLEGLVRLASRNGVSTTREDLRGELERQSAGAQREDPRFFLRLVAASQREIVGTGLARPSVFAPTGMFVVSVQVDASHRRQGIGTAIMSALEDQILRRGGWGLEGRIGTGDPATYRWAFACDFAHYIDELRCVLPVEEAQLPHSPAVGAPPGIAYFPLAEAVGGVGLSRLCDLTATLLTDIPEMAGGKGPSADAVRSFFTNRTSLIPHATWVASEGEQWVGATVNAGHGDGDIYTWFTGVERRLWGQGIGTALKVRAIQSARSLGAGRLIADVASTNAPMLAVNHRLGYVVSSSVPVLRKSLLA